MCRRFRFVTPLLVLISLILTGSAWSRLPVHHPTQVADDFGNRATWYVSTLGDDFTGDGSQGNPFATIQKGIDMAGNGDAVQVAQGHYLGDGNRDLQFHDFDILLMAEPGSIPRDVIIDAGGDPLDPHQCFRFTVGDHFATMVHGFTITGGWTSESGGGILINAASPTFIDCRIIGNFSYSPGGGIMVSDLAGPTFDNCLIAGNKSEEEGGGICCEDSSSITMHACTIAGNLSYKVGGGLSLANYASVGLWNSIVWSNCAELGGAQIDLDNGTVTSSAVFECCDVDSSGADGIGIYYDGGTIFVDPLFCSPSACESAPDDNISGYRMYMNSPCLGTGCGDMGALGGGCAVENEFVDMAVQLGLAVPGRGRGVAWCSIGDSRLLDIFVAVNQGPLHLYKNDYIRFLQSVDLLLPTPDYSFGVVDPYFSSCYGTTSEFEAPPGIDWSDYYYGKLTNLDLEVGCCWDNDSTDPDDQFIVEHNGYGSIDRTIQVTEVYDPEGVPCWHHRALADGWFKINNPSGIEDFWIDFELYGPFGCGMAEDCQPHAYASADIQLWEDGIRPLFCAAWASINYDPFGDIFLGNQNAPDLLYVWDHIAGQYVEVGATAGIGGGNVSTRGASWVDIDGNGMLDLFLARDGFANNFYLNTSTSSNPADISFTDIGPGTLGMVETAATRSAAWCDFDNDGDLDLYVVNIDGPNRFFVFDGLSCVEMGDALGVDDPGTGLGCAWGDYDNDGDFDLYLTNNTEPNRLFRNNLMEGGQGFSDVAPSRGVADTRHSRSCAWIDFDNDGDLDLHVLNSLAGDRLYRNQGGYFNDIAPQLGLDDAGDCVAAGWGDYDEDGDLDAYLSKEGDENSMFRNSGNGNSWLQVNPRWEWLGLWPAIGTRVTAIAGGQVQIREIESTSGYMSQHSPAVEFGFGPGVTTVDSLLINLPDGSPFLFLDVPTNQVFTEDPLTAVPEGPVPFSLSQNFPNPFNPVTEIWFSLGGEERVSLTVYDLSGRRVKTLAQEQSFLPGRRCLTWDGHDDSGRLLASGVYFYRLQVGDRTETRKMTLLK